VWERKKEKPTDQAKEFGDRHLPLAPQQVQLARTTKRENPKEGLRKQEKVKKWGIR
jgi:hypothetical protein